MSEPKNLDELIKENVYLNRMESKPLKDFVLSAYKKYGTIASFKEANKLISILEKYYTKKKIISDNISPYFFELMETAAFVHNLFTNEHWISVFTARDKLYDMAKAAGIKGEHREHIFTIVEGQLGEDMPVAGVRPNPNSPVNDFALCCWIAKELIPNVESNNSD